MRKMRTAEEMFAYYHEHKDPEKKKGFLIQVCQCLMMKDGVILNLLSFF